MKRKERQSYLALSRQDATMRNTGLTSLRLCTFARETSLFSALSCTPEVGEAADPPEEMR
jgi:hypothetical protein